MAAGDNHTVALPRSVFVASQKKKLCISNCHTTFPDLTAVSKGLEFDIK